MKLPVRAHTLLKKMIRIQHMERGKLCRMAGRPHYNLQSWQNGRNVVRYVPREQVASVQKAIQGYEQFMKLVQNYATAIIEQTRKHRTEEFAKSNKSRRKRAKNKKTV